VISSVITRNIGDPHTSCCGSQSCWAASPHRHTSQPRIFFQRSRPRGWPWWPWWPSTIGRVRANAWLWFGLGAHPGGLGVHNARDTPCPEPEACPAHRRTSVQARPYRLRSARNATRRPGAAGWCGAVVFGRRVRGSSHPKRHTGAAQAAQVPGDAPQPMAVSRACWADGRPARHISGVHGACPAGTGPLRRPRALGQHDGATRRCELRADACCWYLLEGG
jgi:hypothetical protein